MTGASSCRTTAAVISTDAGLQHIIDLYDAWDKPDQAAQWRAEMVALIWDWDSSLGR